MSRLLRSSYHVLDVNPHTSLLHILMEVVFSGILTFKEYKRE